MCVCQREKSFAWLLRIDYFSLKWNIEPELAQLWWDSLIGWNCGKWIMSVSHATPLMDGKIPPSPTASFPHPLTRELVISKLCLLKWIANIHYVSIWLSSWPRLLRFIFLTLWMISFKEISVAFGNVSYTGKKKKKVWLCLSCHSKTLEGLFSCFLISVLDFGFLCWTAVAWCSNNLEQKSQQFFQKAACEITRDLNYCFVLQKLSISVSRTHMVWRVSTL